MSAQSILTLENIRKSFGGLVALDGVSLGVDRKTITGLIGPNGSGKSTLFNIVSGSFRADEGKVRFENSDITSLNAHDVFRKGIYRTFQSPQTVPGLSVLENMLLADPMRSGEGLLDSLIRRSMWKSREEKLIERAYEHLRFLSLDQYANESPSILSGGQLKLLEIGRALMSNASVLLLDEPVAGVNPTLARKIFDFLEHLRDELNVTIFVIEHKIDLVFERTDKVFVMNKGKILFSGTPKEVSVNEAVIDAYLGE